MLVTALLDTIRKSFVNMVFLMALLIFIFGILGFYFFGTGESGDKENWGTLGSAMLTLFAFVTVSTIRYISIHANAKSKQIAYVIPASVPASKAEKCY